MEKKLVPLVLYRNGRRDIVGEAEIQEDGTIKAVFHDNELAKEILSPMASGEFSFSQPHVDSTFCWDCREGSCIGSMNDKFCVCCQTAHVIGKKE